MNDENFFTTDGKEKHFHKVIALHDSPDLEWNELVREIPFMPRGWFELARLKTTDRIEFTLHYWLSQLPFSAENGGELERRLIDYFENLDEIGIYATQIRKGLPFEAHMVYSKKEEAGFFQGGPPALTEKIETLINRFAHLDLPSAYLDFFKIHDGFSQYTDIGLIKARDMAQVYQRFQHKLQDQVLIGRDGRMIDPKTLIPFYESSDLHNYQCFYSNWYPGKEMGNVFFSEEEEAFTPFLDNRAFPTFLSWLMDYLERI